MTDRKIFDVTIGVMIGVFVLSILSYVIFDMDSSVSDFSISNNVNPVYGVANSSSFSSANSLDNDIFNGSNYVLGNNQQIDTRMQGQGMTNGMNNKGLVSDFFSNASLTKWDYHGLITKFIISMFTLIVGIVAIRMMLGYTRV